MVLFKKRWLSLLAGVAFVLQSATAGANIISDYELEFSEVDNVSLGEAFDVDVYLDIPQGVELASFGFDFVNPFTHLQLDGFSVANWLSADNFNDVGGVGFFGPDGDDTYIATLHFTAIAEGYETVYAFGELFENGGGAYFYDYIFDSLSDGSLGGSFGVKVPEPAAISLMLIGALGLVRLRSRKK